MEYSYQGLSVKKLLELYENGNLDLSPKYQRSFVWNNKFKGYLILSLLKKYRIGIFVRWWNPKTQKFEIVDGQQRLRTIFYFVRSTDKQFVNFRFEEHKNEYRKLLLKDYQKGNLENLSEDILKEIQNQTINFKNLPKVYQDRVYDAELLFLDIKTEDEKAIAEYFRYIQNQDPLTTGEILSTSLNNPLSLYITVLRKQIEDIAIDILMFKNKRKEFEKLFVNIIGLKENALQLGSTSRKVYDFFYKKQDGRLENTTIIRIEAFRIFLDKLIEDLKVEDANFKINSWKRFFKLFLILFFVNNFNFKNNLKVQLEELVKINENLTIHASKKSENHEKKQKLRQFYISRKYWNFDLESKLFKITQEAHTRETVEEVCQPLVSHLEDWSKKKD